MSNLGGETFSVWCFSGNSFLALGLCYLVHAGGVSGAYHML